MELKLEPIEGEKVLSEEEKERIKRRALSIPEEVISQFSDAEQQEMKSFLASLIVLTEQYHHDSESKEDYKDNLDHYKAQIDKIQAGRVALFKNPSPSVTKLIKLLELYPMEPWHEYELMIAGVRGDDLKRYYETTMKATVDEHHIRVEGNMEKEQEDLQKRDLKCRMTPKDIQDIVLLHSLGDLVKHLIASRQIISGKFWNVGMYDL